MTDIKRLIYGNPVKLSQPFRIVFDYIKGFRTIGGYYFLRHSRAYALYDTASEITPYFLGSCGQGTLAGYSLELSAVFCI